MQQLHAETIRAPSSDDVAATLVDVTPVVMRRIRTEMRLRTLPGLSVSVPQFRVLNYLLNHPGASLSAVADQMGLTMPSASKLVQRLVTQGVVTREVGRDRRRVHLTLTEQGQTSLALARLETRKQLAQHLATLSPRELATVAAALRVLGRAFAEGGPDGRLS